MPVQVTIFRLTCTCGAVLEYTYYFWPGRVQHIQDGDNCQHYLSETGHDLFGCALCHATHTPGEFQDVKSFVTFGGIHT